MIDIDYPSARQLEAEVHRAGGDALVERLRGSRQAPDLVLAREDAIHHVADQAEWATCVFSREGDPERYAAGDYVLALVIDERPYVLLYEQTQGEGISVRALYEA